LINQQQESQMKSFFKSLTTLSVAVAALTSLPVQAVVVSFGGQNTNVLGGDQSGLTSNYVPVSNVAPLSSGYFVETFDRATASSELAAGTTDAVPQAGIAIQQGSGCAINSYGAVTISTTGGGFGVRKATEAWAATPLNDTTCFGFGPQQDGSLPATTKVDYTSFLNLLIGNNAVPAGTAISYLGLYYGSIDNYNDIAFYNGNTLLTGAGIMSDGVISGQEILASQGGSPGDQFGTGSNVYVNLFFSPGETFTAFEFRTSGVAFELDNIVVGLTSRNDVPEPSSIALLGLGLLGFAAVRRGKSVK
jgi:hypothetical protein